MPSVSELVARVSRAAQLDAAGLQSLWECRLSLARESKVAIHRAAATVVPLAFKVAEHAIPGDARPAEWWRAQLASLPQDVPGLDAITDACSITLTKAWTIARSESKAKMMAWLLLCQPRGAKR
eukprot:4872034-Pyramimonas_sp.AAC.1